MSSKTNSEVRERADAAIVLSVSAFPSELWREWDEDCKARFGDCRWIKMWNDHMRARDFEMYEALLKRIGMLESEIEIIQNKKIEKKEEEKQVVKTWGKVIRNDESNQRTEK